MGYTTTDRRQTSCRWRKPRYHHWPIFPKRLKEKVWLVLDARQSCSPEGNWFSFNGDQHTYARHLGSVPQDGRSQTTRGTPRPSRAALGLKFLPAPVKAFDSPLAFFQCSTSMGQSGW